MIFFNTNFFNNFFPKINYFSISVGSVGLIVGFIFLYPNNLNYILFLIAFLIISFSIFILFFFNYLYNNKFRNFINKPEYISMYLKNKDKNFILFKNNLINIYYSSIIILIIFLLSIDKYNYFVFLLTKL